MKHNGERRPEDIQAEIARTRGDMDATLTAIEQRLTPGQLVDQGIDYVRNSGGKEFVSNLGGSVKNNPLPVALMGIGIAWLMASGNRKPSYLYARSESSGPGMMQRASESMSSAKEGMSSAKDSLSESTRSARERVGQMGQSARQQVDRVRGQAQRVRSGYESMVRDQPLALGAIGLAIGACLAAAAPRTRKEDELMGEASDRLADQAKQAGKAQLEKAQQVATAAKDAAVGEVKRESAPRQPSGPPSSQPSGRPKVIEPARGTPLGGDVTPKDPRLGTP